MQPSRWHSSTDKLQTKYTQRPFLFYSGSKCDAIAAFCWLFGFVSASQPAIEAREFSLGLSVRQRIICLCSVRPCVNLRLNCVFSFSFSAIKKLFSRDFMLLPRPKQNSYSFSWFLLFVRERRLIIEETRIFEIFSTGIFSMQLINWNLKCCGREDRQIVQDLIITFSYKVSLKLRFSIVFCVSLLWCESMRTVAILCEVKWTEWMRLLHFTCIASTRWEHISEAASFVSIACIQSASTLFSFSVSFLPTGFMLLVVGGVGWLTGRGKDCLDGMLGAWLCSRTTQLILRRIFFFLWFF